MSRSNLEREIQVVLGNLATLERQARQSEADKEGLLVESLEELRTTVEELLVAGDELCAESE